MKCDTNILEVKTKQDKDIIKDYCPKCVYHTSRIGYVKIKECDNHEKSNVGFKTFND